MKNYKQKHEQNFIRNRKDKETADKRMLRIQAIIGIVCVAFMLILGIVASCVQMEEWLRIVLVCVGVAPLLAASPYMLRIEQKAGYYHCEKCGHKYVPDYKSVFFASHVGHTRKMVCPNCGKKSWQKKVICKD